MRCACNFDLTWRGLYDICISWQLHQLLCIACGNSLTGVNEANGSVCAAWKHSHGNFIPFSNGDNRDLVAEHPVKHDEETIEQFICCFELEMHSRAWRNAVMFNLFGLLFLLFASQVFVLVVMHVFTCEDVLLMTVLRSQPQDFPFDSAVASTIVKWIHLAAEMLYLTMFSPPL